MLNPAEFSPELEQLHQARFAFASPDEFAKLWRKMARILRRAPGALDPDEYLADIVDPPTFGLDSAQTQELDDMVRADAIEDCTVGEFVEVLLWRAAREKDPDGYSAYVERRAKRVVRTWTGPQAAALAKDRRERRHVRRNQKWVLVVMAVYACAAFFRLVSGVVTLFRRQESLSRGLPFVGLDLLFLLVAPAALVVWLRMRNRNARLWAYVEELERR